MHRVMRLAFVMVVLAASPAGAQVRQLEGIPRVHPEPFSQVRGARELADGRLMVSDYIEQRVVALDFASGTATSLFPRGGGPGEIRLPTRLVAMPGDSTLVVDLGNQRLLVVGPTGRSMRTIPGDIPGVLGVNGIDAQGALYYTIPGWAARVPLAGDTVEVVRAPRGGAAVALARIQGDRMRPDIRAPSMTPRIPTVGYAARDAWWVGSDGRVRVLRADTYALEIRAPGGPSRTGPSHAWVTSVVTAADRRRYVEDFLASSPTSGRGENGGMGLTPKPTEAEIQALVAGTHFAERFPMFDAGAVHLAPGDRVWVGRPARPSGARRYDILDDKGTRVGSFELKPGRRVVAISRQWVYLVLTDGDGVEQVERYARPL